MAPKSQIAKSYILATRAFQLMSQGDARFWTTGAEIRTSHVVEAFLGSRMQAGRSMSLLSNQPNNPDHEEFSNSFWNEKQKEHG